MRKYQSWHFLSKAVSGVVEGLIPAEARLLVKLRSAWRKAAGPQVAAHSRPENLRRGTLTIIVDDPQWMTELTLQKDLILENIRNSLKDPLQAQNIAGLKFRVGSMDEVAAIPDSEEPGRAHWQLDQETRRTIDSTVKEIEDPALREALGHYLKMISLKETKD